MKAVPIVVLILPLLTALTFSIQFALIQSWVVYFDHVPALACALKIWSIEGFGSYGNSGTPVSGRISENTTWTSTYSPYIIIGNVTVELDVVLTVEAGVVVKFTEGSWLIVDGALRVLGDDTNPVLFTSNATTANKGSWGGILFRERSIRTLCQVSGAIIEYANWGFSVKSASIKICSSIFRSNNVGVKAYGDNCEVEIDNSVFINNTYGFLGAEPWPAPQSNEVFKIRNSFFSKNEELAIRLNFIGGSAEVLNNTIVNNGRGVYIPEIGNGHVDIINNNVSSNMQSGIAVYMHPIGSLKIFNNTVVNNGGNGITLTWGWNWGISAEISENVVINNLGTGMFIQGSDPFYSLVFVNNTVVANHACGIICGNIQKLHYSKVFSNVPYDIKVTTMNDVNATYNWWGTTNETLIRDLIYDYYDDIDLGRVFYEPFLRPPIVNFTYAPYLPYVLSAITFNASLSKAFYGSIVKYNWDFGDGDIKVVTLPIIAHVYETAGIYNVTLTITDEFELTNSTSTIIAVLEDNIPPVTMDDYDGLWHNTDFTIRLMAVDYESGVAETYYRINNGPIKAVSVDGHPLITTEGANNTLEYWSVDNAGNEELPHKILTGIKLDKTKPSSSISFDGTVGDNNWFISNVTVTLTADDVLSGVDSIFYSFDNVKWEKYVEPFTISNEGVVTVYFKSVDKAGNLESVKMETIKIDKTPPTGSIAINNNAPYTNSTLVTLSLTAIDATSGISKVRFSNDGIWDTEPWEDCTPTKAWIIPEGDGVKTVYVQFMDNAGLISTTYSDIIILDTTPPLIVAVNRQPDGDVEPSQTVKIFVNVTDSLSGVGNVILSYNINNSSTWTYITMTLNVTSGLYEGIILGQQADTLVKYKIIAYDNAGNHVVEDNDGQYYVYTVVPEFPSLIILLALMAFLAYFLNVAKKKLGRGKI
ncbi:MAG: OmpL47-type beta-barrel domain-containing protein [Candidatus Bathyarchaeales archaeon]